MISEKRYEIIKTKFEEFLETRKQIIEKQPKEKKKEAEESRIIVQVFKDENYNVVGWFHLYGGVTCVIEIELRQIERTPTHSDTILKFFVACVRRLYLEYQVEIQIVGD